ncbi:venom serine protease 34-like [Pogonomyrmex barbatus]|uniref:Venom serine protease 34-like n=1 Tax=Pogonomyrmex barbatus TaxID=144034 RepID=A0A6I9WUD7_9HYME|nr:venom serine protease 34-like [Pogonomyrmex barbatus]
MELKIVLFGLLLSLLSLNGVQSDCNYFRNLDAGQTYYVYNKEFPEWYEGINQCVWQMTSFNIVKLNCSIEIEPMTPNCFQDNFSIQFDRGNTIRYCGYKTFTLIGMNPTIRLNSFSNYSKGRFLCQIYASNNDNCQCGWKKVTRIVGGSETEVNEYPMMAGLVDYMKRDIVCGCTIISKQYITTAAHCLEQIQNINNFGIVVGEHDLKTGKY